MAELRCFENLCLRVEKTTFLEPLRDIVIKNEGAVAICIKPDVVSNWLQLAQALFYALYWEVARNVNITALMFLTQKDQIKNALSASAVGSREAICAVLGPREVIDRVEMPRGDPYYPEGRWDPWEITKFALNLVD